MLLPLSWGYCALAVLNRWSWRLPFRRPERVGVPVIVVGNLTVGGTGKTPLAIALADHFRASGVRPGVVSRGYAGRVGTVPHQVMASDSPINVGDEALVLQRRSGVPVAVCTNRVAAARRLVDECDCNLIISDDGLQHHRMYRDLEILVIDAVRGFGNGWCLPAGPLREPRSMARGVGMKVLNGDGSIDTQEAFGMTLEGTMACSLRAAHHHICLSSLRGQRVHAVAGLGHPERFFGFLEAAGLIVERHAFPDHHAYAKTDFPFADGYRVVLMTEKDSVKCQSLELPGPVFFVPVTACLSPAFYQTVRQHLGHGFAPRTP